MGQPSIFYSSLDPNADHRQHGHFFFPQLYHHEMMMHGLYPIYALCQNNVQREITTSDPRNLFVDKGNLSLINQEDTFFDLDDSENKFVTESGNKSARLPTPPKSRRSFEDEMKTTKK